MTIDTSSPDQLNIFFICSLINLNKIVNKKYIYGCMSWSLLIGWLNKNKYLCLRKVQQGFFHISWLHIWSRDEHSSTKCVWGYFHLSIHVLVGCKNTLRLDQVVWLAMLKSYYPKRSQIQIHLSPSILGIHVCQQNLF